GRARLDSESPGRPVPHSGGGIVARRGGERDDHANQRRTGAEVRPGQMDRPGGGGRRGGGRRRGGGVAWRRQLDRDRREHGSGYGFGNDYPGDALVWAAAVRRTTML